MTENVGTTADLAEAARRFIAAFNTRDLDRFEGLLVEDAEFRTRQGRALRGDAGLRALITAAEDANIRLEPIRDPQVEGDGRVAVPVTVVTGKDRIRGTAVFEVRDGRIAAFEVVPDE